MGGGVVVSPGRPGSCQTHGPEVSSNENPVRRLFILGRDSSVCISRPGTRSPSETQPMKNGFGEPSAEAAPPLPAKT